jgi:hypothetical protein
VDESLDFGSRALPERQHSLDRGAHALEQVPRRARDLCEREAAIVADRHDVSKRSADIHADLHESPPAGCFIVGEGLETCQWTES